MTAPNVTSDWKFSNQFLPSMKSILCQHMIAVAPLAQDRNLATDLVMLTGRNVSVAARIRRKEYSRYADEFTLRLSRPSGAKSEYEKICEGNADLMLYGFDSGDGKTVSPWSLIDLRALRAHLILSQTAVMSGEQRNPIDGTMFRFFKISSFPAKPPILIASSSQTVRRSA